MWEGLRKEEEEGRTTCVDISNYNPTMPKISLFSKHPRDSATGRTGQCRPVLRGEELKEKRTKGTMLSGGSLAAQQEQKTD